MNCDNWFYFYELLFLKLDVYDVYDDAYMCCALCALVTQFDFAQSLSAVWHGVRYSDYGRSRHIRTEFSLFCLSWFLIVYFCNIFPFSCIKKIVSLFQHLTNRVHTPILCVSSWWPRLSLLLLSLITSILFTLFAIYSTHNSAVQLSVRERKQKQ